MMLKHDELNILFLWTSLLGKGLNFSSSNVLIDLSLYVETMSYIY